METLPKEILNIIFQYVDLGDQLNLRLVSTLFGNLKIRDLYNIPYEYRKKLSDEILSLPIFSELEKLDTSYNCKITDKSIKKFKRTLKVLDAGGSSSKITNEGIKGMNLHSLYANDNLKITDEGIKGMNLNTLYVPGNYKITNKGIEGMNLHILHAGAASGISDIGIKGMNLHALYADYNFGISDRGIRKMNLYTLYSIGNPNITYDVKNGKKIYK